MSNPTQNNIYHNFFIDASTKKVFEAITDPDHLINWWPLKCSGKPAVGEEYNFNFTDEYNWYGHVIQAEPNRSFHIKMTKSDHDWDPTTFGFDLSEKNGQTYVDFWHKDWPVCNDHFKFSSFCWAILLKGLKDYVEKGVIIPFEERN